MKKQFTDEYSHINDLLRDDPEESSELKQTEDEWGTENENNGSHGDFEDGEPVVRLPGKKEGIGHAQVSNQRPLPHVYQEEYDPGQYGGAYEDDEEYGDESNSETSLVPFVVDRDDPRQPAPQRMGGPDYEEGYEDEDFGRIPQPSYDNQAAQLTNDIAADESQPVLMDFIKKSRIGFIGKTRLMMWAAVFLSKNQVYSNVENIRDFQMVQDDYEYVKLISRCDFTSYDMTPDYLAAEAAIEAQHNIRLRRSRRALNLKQLNTNIQRTENVEMSETAEDKKLTRKYSLLGNNM